MVRYEDIHAADVVFNAGAATILDRVHDPIDHDLGAEGVVAGHGDHARCGTLATGSETVSIAAAAKAAGTVVGHIDLQSVEGLCRAADRSIKIDIFGSPQAQTCFVIGRIEYNSFAAGTVNLHPFSIGTKTRKEEDMIPSSTVIVHEKTQVTGLQLAGGDRIGIVPLAPGGTI